MTNLIERLRAAEAGSRELDAAVTVALRTDCRENLTDDHESLREIRPDDQCAPGTYWFVCRSGMSLRTADRVTTSLDAIMNRAEFHFPGWIWQIDLWPGEATVQGCKDFWGEGYVAPDKGGVYVTAKTPALAFSAAILTAKAKNP